MNKKSIIKKEKNNYDKTIRINRIFSKIQFTSIFLIAILISNIPIQTLSANDVTYDYVKYRMLNTELENNLDWICNVICILIAKSNYDNISGYFFARLK